MIIEKAHLYSLWNGRLVVYVGRIIPSTFAGWTGFKSCKKRHQCSPIPGEIYNGVVWFEDRDDEKAKQILIDYENRMIRNCEIKILSHQQKIKTLEEFPVIEY